MSSIPYGQLKPRPWSRTMPHDSDPMRGNYDDFNPNMPEPSEEPDEPDYDLERDWISLLETYR
jgi:hypothetical protein